MKNVVKIWPYIDDISQAIIPYQKTNLNTENKIFLDFSNVKSINSSGIAITLLKLIPIFEKYKKCFWVLIEPENSDVQMFLLKTGIYETLNNKILKRDLFTYVSNPDDISAYTQYNYLDIKVTSFPLLNLDFNTSDSRSCVDEFVDNILNILLPFATNYKFKLNVLLKLLKEIAKNSEDHTSSNAIFGLDIIENENSKKGIIKFSFCDLGKGIHNNIKGHIAKSNAFRDDASTKFGMVDSYKAAYTPGFTTSIKKNNKGIGMSMILDCVKILDMQLLIYDARSMGFIPKENTHAQIRRNFWNTGNSVGFYYFGTMNLI